MSKLFYGVAGVILIFLLSCCYSFASLKSEELQADYIIIYHPDYKTEIQKLADLRQKDGLSVRLVDINEIYREFGDSAVSSESIRDFLSYVQQYWAKPAPKYVLLAGSINHIPSYKVESFYQPEDSVSLDGIFVMNKFSSENKPEMVIGRLPARNVKELNTIIDKIIAFESARSDSYRYDLLSLTDVKDYESFEQSEKELIKSLPPGKKTKNVSRKPSSQDFTDMEGFRETLNNGTKFVSLFAHGNPDSWTSEGFITPSVLDTLKLSNKPFVLTAVSCSQRFDNPSKQGIIEKVISLDSGGAVATFASAGVGLYSSGSIILDTFYNLLYSDNYNRIGDIILKIKSNGIGKSTPDDDIYHRFSLLGDPCLKLQTSVSSVVSTEEEIPSISLEPFPNPVTDKAEFQFIISGSTEIVTLDMYDSNGLKAGNIFRGELSRGAYTVEWLSGNLAPGVYLCRMTAGNKVVTKVVNISR